VRVRGKENWAKSPRIVVSNHRSEFDILALRSLFKCAAVSPLYYKTFALCKRMIREINPIYVDYTQREGVRASINDHLSGPLKDIPILVFPEGALTNGEQALLLYHKFLFSVDQPIQPLANHVSGPFHNVVNVHVRPHVLTLARSFAYSLRLLASITPLLTCTFPAIVRAASVHADYAQHFLFPFDALACVCHCSMFFSSSVYMTLAALACSAGGRSTYSLSRFAILPALSQGKDTPRAGKGAKEGESVRRRQDREETILFLPFVAPHPRIISIPEASWWVPSAASPHSFLIPPSFPSPRRAQRRRSDETPEQFAQRVQAMTADALGLVPSSYSVRDKAILLRRWTALREGRRYTRRAVARVDAIRAQQQSFMDNMPVSSPVASPTSSPPPPPVTGNPTAVPTVAERGDSPCSPRRRI